MKKKYLIRTVTVALLLMLSNLTATATESAFSMPDALDAGFVEPAMEYGPRTWWHWINERVSKDGITKDLEAMKTMGYKGVHMVNLPSIQVAGTIGDDIVGSEIWYEKVGFAVRECERLGMEFSFGSCPGWVAGGPWVSPAQSMQDIYWRHTVCDGADPEPHSAAAAE